MIRLTNSYPREFKLLVKSNINKHKEILVFYCDTIKELNEIARSYDLSTNIIKAKNNLGKVTFYKVAYGTPYIYRLDKGTDDLLDDSIRIYYTVLNPI